MVMVMVTMVDDGKGYSSAAFVLRISNRASYRYDGLFVSLNKYSRRTIKHIQFGHRHVIVRDVRDGDIMMLV
jgi:hypothetical protein